MCFGLPHRFRLQIVHFQNDHRSAAKQKRLLDAFRNTGTNFLIAPDLHTVHDHFHIMLSTAVNVRNLIQRINHSVDANTHKTAAAQFIPKGFEAVSHSDFTRRQQHQARSFRVLHHTGDDFVSSL